MSFDPFGGMFDFNGDGKTDSFEMALGFQIMDEMDRQSGHRSGGKSASSFDNDDNDEDDGLENDH